jgi:hypothetical protein
VVRKEGGTMLLARWEADIERVIVERVDGSGRVLGYHRMTRDEFSEFLNQAEVVCDEAHGVNHVEAWPDERVELGRPLVEVLDDPEADLPTVVRLSDGSARVDLEFGDDARLERRLGELGRE